MSQKAIVGWFNKAEPKYIYTGGFALKPFECEDANPKKVQTSSSLHRHKDVIEFWDKVSVGLFYFLL